MESIENMKKKFNKVEDGLKQFGQYIDAVVNGKIRSIHYYPAQEVDKVKNWIKGSREQLQNQHKY